MTIKNTAIYARGSTRGLVAIAMAVILSLASEASYSSIHEGLGFANLDSAWDFSDSAGCSLLLGECGDLSMGITLVRGAAGPDGGSWFMLARPPDTRIAIASRDSTYGELTTAPDGPYYVLVVPYPDEVYVIRTNDGHYAKFRGLDLNASGDFAFEYSYQDNGTRVLVDPVSTEPTSWGRIKALYSTGED